MYSTSHCRLNTTLSIPTSPGHRATLPGSDARRTPPVPTASASSQASRCGPPRWVSFLQHAVAHGTSCVALPWPVPAAPPERWPLLRPMAPLDYHVTLHPAPAAPPGCRQTPAACLPSMGASQPELCWLPHFSRWHCTCRFSLLRLCTPPSSSLPSHSAGASNWLALPAPCCPAATSASVGAPLPQRPSRCCRGPCSLLCRSMSSNVITSSPAATLAILYCWPCTRHFLILCAPSPVPYSMLPLRPSSTISFPCRTLDSPPPAACSPRPSVLPVPSVCPALHHFAHVMTRMSTLLLPRPTPRLRTTPPSATAPAASAPWASSPVPRDSPGSFPGAPLRASSSTCPPPSLAPFPLASPPCRRGR